MTLSSIIKGIQPEPFRLLLHGVEGIGKSTFAAKAPDPVFIQTEDGLSRLDVAKFPPAESFDSVIDNLQALQNEPHDFLTVVIDSIDWLEKLATQKIIADQKSNPNGKTTLAEYGFDHGYKLLIPLFETVLNHLNRLRRERGMNVVLIAHTKTEKVVPPTGESYDQFAPRLDKRVNGMVKEWSDIIGFATYEIAVTTKDEGFNNTRNIAKPINDTEGNNRLLRLESNPAIVAKSRYTLPGKMPLDGNAFFAELWQIIHTRQN
jgi:hypothetical protein